MSERYTSHCSALLCQENGNCLLQYYRLPWDGILPGYPPGFVLNSEGMALLCKPGEGRGHFLSRQHWERGTVQMRGDWEGRAAVPNTEQPLLCSPSLRGNREADTCTPKSFSRDLSRPGVLKAVSEGFYITMDSVGLACM